MMRIGYFGDGVWAHNAFKKLLADDEIEISFVTVRFDMQDEVLMGMAKEYGIPVELNPNINSEEFISSIEKYRVDLFVSMSFNQIFKERIIN